MGRSRTSSVASARHLQVSDSPPPATDVEHALLDEPAPPASASSAEPTMQPGMLRWVAHVFVCLITVGQYFIFDFPGAIGVGDHGTIQARFAAHGKPYNQVMNQALYSIYSWPNTVLALVGGILIDRVLGLRRATIMFASLVCVGGWLFFLGVQLTQYPLMMVARFVFGLGAESLSVAQSCFVARWFADGKGIALAFGITITACRVASTANFFFSPRISNDAGVNITTLIGACVTVVSFVSAIVLSLLDRHGERGGMVAEWKKDTSRKFEFVAIFRLPASSLLLGGITAFVYSSIFPFIGIARDFFATMYGISGTEGSTVVSFYQLASAVGSPLFGGVVDGTGYAIGWLAFACSGFAAVHVMFATTTAVPPVAMMVIMGVLYSILVSALWPSAPKTVDASRVGLVYGAMTSMQNILLALVPLATGSVLDAFEAVPGNATVTRGANHTAHQRLGATKHAASPHAHAPHRGGDRIATTTRQGYVNVEYLLLGLAAVSVLLTLCLWAVQVRIHGALHLNAAAARQRVAELAEAHELDAERAALAEAEEKRAAREQDALAAVDPTDTSMKTQSP